MVTFDGINSTTAYNYFVLVITDTSGTATGTLASFSEWELFGTPEYDPEAHGTDVTIKSLPNVPNTDWLEVYYDAKGLADGALSTTSGAISGLGGTTNNGTAYGNPQISNGAFVLDGTSDYISTSVNATLTYHTASMWIMFDNPSTWEAVYFVGPSSVSGGDNFAIYVHADNYFRLESGGGASTFYDVNYTFQPGKWVHMTVVFKGTGLQDCEVYIDNVKLSPRGVSSNPTTDHAITGTNNLNIGARPGYDLEGKIANFRLFNRALTQDEIYQLYAYQKEYFGHGDLSMTLKAGRLGIGTSEPRATLDVRGDLDVRGNLDVRENFQCGNSPLRFYVLDGVHPSSATTVNVPFTEHKKRGAELVSFTGCTKTSSGSVVPWNYHNETNQYEIMVYYNNNGYFSFFGQGTNTFGLPWRMYIVTT
tara:strand:+ start:504 stop:1766 length:1263 start_codon:yes stop_codon:yes gene_type:complete